MHASKILTGGTLAVFLALAGCGSQGTKAASAHQAVSHTTTAPAVQTDPAATPAPSSPTRVKFIVTGSAPDGADITYGSDSDNRTPHAGLGIDGTGTAVPWHGSMAFDGSAEFYSLNAQLNGSGDIRCKIVVTGPGDTPLTVSRARASGGYNICDAQAAPSDPSGMNWQNEG